MHRRLILGFLAAALAGPALASSAKKKEEEGDDNGLFVDMAQVGLPVVQDRRLVNYVFVQIRILLARGANPVSLRTKEPYFRDALVRAAYRTPFSVPGDVTKLDEAKIRIAMTAEARRIAGARAIAGVQVVSQTPQRRRPFPMR
jgi:hypothetical protein